jgi:hypothetical protein
MHSRLPLCPIFHLLVLIGCTFILSDFFAPPLAAQITGNVFVDYNADGLRQNTPGTFVEPGVSGVTVTAFGLNNAVLATGTTGSTGNFSLPVATGTPARIEVTNLPPGLQPGPVGTGSATTVSFVTSPATVGIGLLSPADYCNANPSLALPCYVNGNPEGGGTAGTGPALVTFPYYSPTYPMAKVPTMDSSISARVPWSPSGHDSGRSRLAAWNR